MRLPQGSAINGAVTEAVSGELTAPGPRITLISPNLLRQKDVVEAEAKVKGSPKERVKEQTGTLARVKEKRGKARTRARKQKVKSMPAPIRAPLKCPKRP